MAGFLLLLHTIFDVGMLEVFRRWGRNKCHFPIVWFLKPLSVEWMYLLYVILVLAAIGIMIGCLYRCCLIIFNVIFWYIFSLDTTASTCHYYLFGLVTFLLLITDGNRYCSIDCLLWPEIRNQEIPLWNYAILRFQIFVMYFVAGIQKLNPEWWYGWGCIRLAEHWVFDIFRLFLTNDQINLYVVHRLGCIIELLIGFLLFFDKSRKSALFLIYLFHGMLVGLDSEIGGVYSIRWAMMIWWIDSTDHIFITDKGQYNPISRQIGYKRASWLYLSNPVHLKQFNDCIAKEVSLDERFGITHIAWLTINSRFPQRWYHPEDITKVKWSLFSNPTFSLPIMEDYWEMRELKKERKKYNSEFTDLLFMSDFPGYSFNLEISNKADNTTIEVLKGRVIATDLSTGQNMTVEAGQTRV
ncbi:vitamin K-dependent gamma-carboxylase-like, partial [Mizuhopecten yessoensis]|uniref:vitamin K-dependent gamma-carboxylase-like n=1 Tax=Mizuhopecten yessoensis TaxID=6573 RepID=UPI000B45921E